MTLDHVDSGRRMPVASEFALARVRTAFVNWFSPNKLVAEFFRSFLPIGVEKAVVGVDRCFKRAALGLSTLLGLGWTGLVLAM